jgi:hypothetical protein
MAIFSLPIIKHQFISSPMLNKRITILISLAMLTVSTLAQNIEPRLNSTWEEEDSLPTLREMWEQDRSVNIFGDYVDLATECDGQPCNWPPLPPPRDQDRPFQPDEPTEILTYCDIDESCPGSEIFSMSDEDWEENFGDEEKDAAWMEKTGSWCATTQQYRRHIREEKRRAKQIDQNNN